VGRMDNGIRVKLVNYTKKPLETVTWAALISYWEGWETEAFERMDESDVEMHLPRILGYGHESILEHATLTFAIEGISRVTCYDEKTEVLTREGWKPIGEVKLEDEIACLDDEGYLRWYRPQAKIEQEYEGYLLHFESSSIDLLVTPEHRMWVFDYDKRSEKTRKWKFIMAKNLSNGRYKFKKNAKWDAPDVEVTIPAHPRYYKKFPQIHLDAKRTGDLFELLGIWVTDGSYCGGRRCLAISQTKSSVRARIKELCDRLGFHWREYHIKSRGGYVIKIGNLQHVKFVESLFGAGAKTGREFVPDLIKNASATQIERFLKGVIAGDGTKYKGHIQIYTASKKFADDLQELFMKVGLSANIRKYAPRDRGEIKGKKVGMTTKSIYVVSVHGKKRSEHLFDRRSAKKFGEPVYYKGKVYSLVVPYHRIYVRRNGKAVWSGNSHQLVRHRLASYTQQSQRYIILNPKDVEETFIIPEGIKNDSELLNEWKELMKKSIELYKKSIERGHHQEDARFILPQAVRTKIVVTMNLRELKHFLGLRACERAQWEIREVAWKMLEEIAKNDDLRPIIKWAKLGPRCIQLGYCPEGELMPPNCWKRTKEKWKALVQG
jgi:thymidylate synthase ThyX/intein/homing endonuclease